MLLTLDTLPALVKKRKRIGRGGARGGTSGRGHKGQKARTGGASKVRTSFEGGQTPLVRRLPKRGFNNALFATSTSIINLESLERAFEVGSVIDATMLVQKGLVSGALGLIKILGKGTLTKKFIVHADAFSQGAQEAIERVGGKCVLNGEIE